MGWFKNLFKRKKPTPRDPLNFGPLGTLGWIGHGITWLIRKATRRK